jgi:hypothetical protein
MAALALSRSSTRAFIIGWLSRIVNTDKVASTGHFVLLFLPLLLFRPIEVYNFLFAFYYYLLAYWHMVFIEIIN